MPILPKSCKVLWRSLELNCMPKSFYRVSVFLMGLGGFIIGILVKFIRSFLLMDFWCEMFAYVPVCGIWFAILLEELRMILEDCDGLLEHRQSLLEVFNKWAFG